MKIPILVSASLIVLTLALPGKADDSCHYMKSRSALSGYENGGPYKLEHFKMTKDRRDLREFLWNHWHGHAKGIAEARVGTNRCRNRHGIVRCAARRKGTVGHRRGNLPPHSAASVLGLPC
jgi:hypothetical protein